jgi:hypothetical protein
MSKLAQSFRDSDVDKDAFQLQQRIFLISKACPNEERYSLTDQVGRSSRSIGANIAPSPPWPRLSARDWAA